MDARHPQKATPVATNNGKHLHAETNYKTTTTTPETASQLVLCVWPTFSLFKLNFIDALG